MYIGIGPESKKRVLEEDAFSYACDRIYSGTEEEQDLYRSTNNNDTKGGNLTNFF